jgi:hypothetical protein
MALYLIAVVSLGAGIVTYHVAPNYDRELRSLAKLLVVIGIGVALLPWVMGVGL